MFYKQQRIVQSQRTAEDRESMWNFTGPKTQIFDPQKPQDFCIITLYYNPSSRKYQLPLKPILPLIIYLRGFTPLRRFEEILLSQLTSETERSTGDWSLVVLECLPLLYS